MKTSPEGRAFIMRWEGVELRAYQDVAGFWTIGVGHLLTRPEFDSGRVAVLDLPWRNGITATDADAILALDLAHAEAAVENAVTVPLTQPQFDALVSWTFNLGAGNLRRSTMLTHINDGRADVVPQDMRQWCKAGGMPVHGLLLRRISEGNLWEGGDYGHH